MTPQFSLFVLGAILTCILTPLVRYLALQKGFVDCPHRAMKVHQQETPRLAGASILLSFLIVVMIAGFAVPQLSTMLWGNDSLIGSIILGSLGIFTIRFYKFWSSLDGLGEAAQMHVSSTYGKYLSGLYARKSK